MRDFPMFTTENGAASLVLREIPYRGAAYITIQSTLSLEALLKECVDFAVAAGAEQVYATGHAALEAYPLHTAVCRLAASREKIPRTDAAIFPVTEQTRERFRELYNRRMENVPASAYMTKAMAREMLQKGGGYFVHRGGKLLGIGVIWGNEIRALASCEPGAGTIVLRTLCHGIPDDTIVLESASENHRAMALYRREGFLPQRELLRWYRVK